MQTIRFDYKLPARKLFPMLLVAIAIPIAIAYTAASVHSSLRIAGIITLSPSQAAKFFLFLSFVTAPVAVLALWLAFKTCFKPSFVELCETSLVAPKASPLMSSTSIPYSSISEMRVVEIRGEKSLQVRSGVCSLDLQAYCFPTPADFLTFVERLHERSRC